MKQALSFLLLLPFFVCNCNNKKNTSSGSLEVWLTDPVASVLFQKQDSINSFTDATKDTSDVIKVDESQTFQTMDGFGYALTGGSAMLLHQMDAGKRTAIIRELFGTDSTNIGISYLRVSLGASDLDDHVFSYNDL